MGLRNAQGFVRLVLAMKQNLPPMPSAASILDRGFVSNIETALSASSAPPSEDVTSILHDIRDELRHHNTILQTLKVPTTES